MQLSCTKSTSWHFRLNSGSKGTQSVDKKSFQLSPNATFSVQRFFCRSLSILIDDLFRQEFISENVLQRLIRQNVFKKSVHESSQDTSSATGACLYTKNRECNYFLLVLKVGESNLLFEAGPFCYFGYELLQKNTDDIYGNY
uniref:Uncharacterized protein n=1 Tax=Romanomermis culicivorax TaxID=13658 RepID=A0A915I6H4_ROMCU